MRLSTVLISSAFMLAGMSDTFVESRNMLGARFVGFDFGEVEARAYDEELGLYAHGGAISINTHKPFSYTSNHRRAFYDKLHSETIRCRNLPWEEEYSQTETHNTVRVANLPSKSCPSRRRRFFYEPSRIDITRRRDLNIPPGWMKEYRKLFRNTSTTGTYRG